MNDLLVQQKARIRIYSCGGAGMNIGQRFEARRNHDEIGFAGVDVTYIDTSRSNLRSSIDPVHVYLLQGMDGSGKIRSENHEQIGDCILDILQQHKPLDLNIVLSSASGGSGSVIAPLLVSELLERKNPVIALAIGSTDSVLDIENTLKTIKSYDSIAQRRKAGVVMSYAENGQITSRQDVDRLMEKTIVRLCALYSRENRELDSQDLFNFMRFERSTSFKPQLAALSIIDGDGQISDLGHVMSVATLTTLDANSDLSTIPEYRCVGYLPDQAAPPVLKEAPLHFVTSDGVFPQIAADLQKLLREMRDLQDARRKKQNISTDDDNAAQSGLVL